MNEYVGRLLAVPLLSHSSPSSTFGVVWGCQNHEWEKAGEDVCKGEDLLGSPTRESVLEKSIFPDIGSHGLRHCSVLCF